MCFQMMEIHQRVFTFIYRKIKSDTPAYKFACGKLVVNDSPQENCKFFSPEPT